jgi:hypothetical protein
MKDNINPSHYRQSSKIECIDALEAATVNKKGLDAICTANIIKYLWRSESKGGLEDLKKAQWYLSKMINHNTPKEEFVHPSAAKSTDQPKSESWSEL